MPLSLNPRPIVRLWLLADILLGRDLHPLLPRKRTLALTPLSNRAALRALIGNPTRYFALWAVFWPADTHLGAQLAWLPIPIKEPPQGRILPNYSLNLIDVRISY